MTLTQSARYPLGTDAEELERLQLQHRLWSDAAHALWSRAGVAPGSRVLDVGAGPGAASFDLAQLTTSSGRVVAVDESPRFVESVREEARRRAVAHVSAAVADVQDLGSVPALEPASFDLAYARWVLCFTSRPADVVRGVATLLARGGAFCVHDYFDYERMSAAPRREAYTHMVRATAKSWRDRGGDPDVAAKLPGLLRDAGLDVTHLAVHQRIARPGDTMWQWPLTWWRSYVPKLVSMGYVTKADAAAFHRDVAAMTSDRDFVMLPPVFELVARRPR